MYYNNIEELEAETKTQISSKKNVRIIFFIIFFLITLGSISGFFYFKMFPKNTVSYSQLISQCPQSVSSNFVKDKFNQFIFKYTNKDLTAVIKVTKSGNDDMDSFVGVESVNWFCTEILLNTLEGKQLAAKSIGKTFSGDLSQDNTKISVMAVEPPITSGNYLSKRIRRSIEISGVIKRSGTSVVIDTNTGKKVTLIDILGNEIKYSTVRDNVVNQLEKKGLDITDINEYIYTYGDISELPFIVQDGKLELELYNNDKKEVIILDPKLLTTVRINQEVKEAVQKPIMLFEE